MSDERNTVPVRARQSTNGLDSHLWVSLIDNLTEVLIGKNDLKYTLVVVVVVVDSKY